MVSTATEAITLDPDAFARLVTEEGLKTTDLGGYRYVGKRGKNGWELYKAYGTPRAWLYQARRVATQANAAGGAMIVDLTVASGMMLQLVGVRAVNTGTNGINVLVVDEDNATSNILGAIASAAGTSVNIPSIGIAPTTSANSLHSLGLFIGPGQKLSIQQTAAGVQNDTIHVAATFLLPLNAATDGSDIAWSTSRSTNAGDVTLAASTISAANTMQVVYLP